MPTARQTASVAPAVVAPSAPCAAHAARSRGPTLRASGESPKRSSCSSVSPTWMAPSMTPTVAGTAQATRTRRSASAADRGSFAAREAVGDERRLERDDRPPSLERGAHLGMDAEELGHRAFRASLPSARRSGPRPRARARGRRRGSRRRRRRPRRSCRRPPPAPRAVPRFRPPRCTTQPRAPRFTATVSASTGPTSSASASLANTSAGCERRRATRGSGRLPRPRSRRWKRGRR